MIFSCFGKVVLGQNQVVLLINEITVMFLAVRLKFQSNVLFPLIYLLSVACQAFVWIRSHCGQPEIELYVI